MMQFGVEREDLKEAAHSTTRCTTLREVVNSLLAQRSNGAEMISNDQM